MDRLLDLDVRRLVQLLVRTLPRLVLVGGLWRSVGARGIVRSGIGGIFVVMAIVHMSRALQGANIRTSRRVGVGGKGLVSTALSWQVAWPHGFRVLGCYWLMVARG